MLAVLDSGGFSDAADRLGTSQSNVSQSVRQLEAIVGTALFRRGPRGATPTPACLEIEHTARQIVAQLEGLRAAQRSDAEMTGAVRIACFQSIATHLLPPVLAALRERHPLLRIEVDAACPSYRDPERQLLDGRAHIALGQLPMQASLFTAVITHDDWVVVMPRPIDATERDPWPRLRRLAWIQYAGGPPHPAIVRLLDDRRVNTVPIMTMSEDSSLMAAVARGVGFAVMPRLATNPSPANVQIVDLPEPVPRILGLGVDPRLMSTPPVRAVLRAVLGGGGGSTEDKPVSGPPRIR